MMIKKHKQTNIELLRIMCAFMVIAFHMISQSNVLDDCTTANFAFSVFFHAGGRLACSVFVIIGAYFLVNIPFRTYRIAHLYIKTFVTVAVINLSFAAFGGNIAKTISIKEMIVQMFPLGGTYWFVDTYLYMLILSPILNLLANESSKQKYRYLLLVFSGMFVIVGSSPATFKLSPFSNDLIWFCFLYLLTGELKHRGTF